MTDVRRQGCVWLLIAALAGAGGCATPPTTPTVTPTIQTLVFSSRLTAGGTVWKSFNVPSTGNVTVRLALLTPDDTLVVRIGLGTFDGTTCTPFITADTGTNDTDPQITYAATVGRYCVQISDIGNLTRINDFGIFVVLPAA